MIGDGFVKRLAKAFQFSPSCARLLNRRKDIGTGKLSTDEP